MYGKWGIIAANVWLDGEEEAPTLIYNIYISARKPIEPFLKTITDHHVVNNSYKSLLGGDFNVYVGNASCDPFHRKCNRPSLHNVPTNPRAQKLIHFLNQYLYYIANGYLAIAC